jgi:phospholipid transport system substrate-binding protein
MSLPTTGRAAARARGAALALWLALLAVAPAAPGAAPGPTEQLRAAVDRVLRILQDRALAPAERRRDIRQVADEMFDFEEMARRVLAQRWRALSPEQRRQFVPLFSDLLERTYVSTIERYKGEPIQYAGQRVEDDDVATVLTRIITKQGQEVPVDYRMLRRGDRWLIYDVIVEGVGLVGNYRSQFNSILASSSYDELAKRIRKRIDELDAAAPR